jgi:hypothetical protein
LPEEIKNEWRDYYKLWRTGEIPNEQMSEIMAYLWTRVGDIPIEIQPYDRIKERKKGKKSKT